MNVRRATTDDCEAIRGIAERSFEASYSLSPDGIETILETEFADDAVAERVEDDDALVLVAEEEGRPVGFADADAGERTLRWLHVDPTERGRGAGTSLVEAIRSQLPDGDDPFSARVLDEATEGATFLERFGLDRTDTTVSTFGQAELSAHRYTLGVDDDEPNEPSVDVPDSVVVDGAERPVDRSEELPGTEAPFFPTYVDADRSDPHGFFCSNCGSTAVVGDDLDRLECGDCGNRHEADDWDDAYL